MRGINAHLVLCSLWRRWGRRVLGGVFLLRAGERKAEYHFFTGLRAISYIHCYRSTAISREMI